MACHELLVHRQHILYLKLSLNVYPVGTTAAAFALALHLFVVALTPLSATSPVIAAPILLFMAAAFT